MSTLSLSSALSSAFSLSISLLLLTAWLALEASLSAACP